MARKRYADKHKAKIEESMPQVPVYESLLPPKRTKTPYEEKLMGILLEPTNFKNKFLALNLDEQLAMNCLLFETLEYGRNNYLSGFTKDFTEGAGYLLDNILDLAGTEFDKGVFTKIHRDEKRLIRMECHGTINLRESHQLSVFYKFFNRPENRGKWNLRAYDMKKSPMWRVFMQFESFRKIMPNVRKYLQKKGINPDALKVMTVSDFCDVIFHAYQKSSKDTKVSFLPEGESIKAKYVKEFMCQCGDKYRKMKLEEAEQRGIRPEAVESLCNAMRLFGITEPSKVTVTSFEYTPKIVEDLVKAGYEVEDIEIGSPIPQEFTDYLVMHHQEKLIQARDKNGKPITTEGLEGEELHHIGAVLIAANNGYLARTNYPSMFVLLGPRLHKKLVHYYDRILKHNDEEQFYQRLTIKDKKTRAMLGFGKNKRIYGDFEDTEEFKKREAEDKLQIVSYNKMTAERLKNEIEIAQKYKISYTKMVITQKLDEIKNIGDYSDDDSLEFRSRYRKWLKEQKQSRRQKKKKVAQEMKKAVEVIPQNENVSKKKKAVKKKKAEERVIENVKVDEKNPKSAVKKVKMTPLGKVKKQKNMDKHIMNFVLNRIRKGKING